MVKYSVRWTFVYYRGLLTWHFWIGFKHTCTHFPSKPFVSPYTLYDGKLGNNTTFAQCFGRVKLHNYRFQYDTLLSSDFLSKMFTPRIEYINVVVVSNTVCLKSEIHRNRNKAVPVYSVQKPDSTYYVQLNSTQLNRRLRTQVSDTSMSASLIT